MPGLGRTLGGGNGNPHQYSCLKNPMDRGAWWATIHRVTENRIRLKRLSTHTQEVVISLGPSHTLGSVFCSRAASLAKFCMGSVQ